MKTESKSLPGFRAKQNSKTNQINWSFSADPILTPSNPEVVVTFTFLWFMISFGDYR